MFNRSIVMALSFFIVSSCGPALADEVSDCEYDVQVVCQTWGFFGWKTIPGGTYDYCCTSISQACSAASNLVENAPPIVGRALPDIVHNDWEIEACEIISYDDVCNAPSSGDGSDGSGDSSGGDGGDEDDPCATDN